MYDLIIIGGGPAAVSAGIYAARKKLKTILITKGWGGQMALAPEIENYAGFESITGAELVSKFTQHLKKNELEIKEGVEIKDIKLVDNLVEVKVNDDVYQAKVAIITTGRNPRKLGLPNEDKFIGKGISYCSTCDAPLFRDKEVAVIGGGNMGLGTALDLITYASKVYILEYSPELKADKYFQEKIKKIDKIEVITSVKVAEIKGDQFVSSLTYSNGTGGKNKELPVQGIFIAIGSDASSFLVKNVVELNKENEIKIDSRNRTSQPNIFAAGDVTDISHKQIVIAAGEGAKAALNAYDYLQNLN
ncbi:MAG: FAD-dependent oxidoreductase [Candidatus Portnoybacteria bacterium]|nr:FAD-dependent oxidoreductase [Candidatus Portnoybacteria bacterium]